MNGRYCRKQISLSVMRSLLGLFLISCGSLEAPREEGNSTLKMLATNSGSYGLVLSPAEILVKSSENLSTHHLFDQKQEYSYFYFTPPQAGYYRFEIDLSASSVQKQFWFALWTKNLVDGKQIESRFVDSEERKTYQFVRYFSEAKKTQVRLISGVGAGYKHSLYSVNLSLIDDNFDTVAPEADFNWTRFETKLVLKASFNEKALSYLIWDGVKRNFNHVLRDQRSITIKDLSPSTQYTYEFHIIDDSENEQIYEGVVSTLPDLEPVPDPDPVPEPDPEPEPSIEPLTLLSPAPGSTLTSSTATFTWKPNGETTYAIAIGTEPALGNLFWSQDFTNPSATVSNLPTDGSTIYIRIFDLADWSAKDFSVIAYTGSPDPVPSPDPEPNPDPTPDPEPNPDPVGEPLTLISPAPGSILTSSTATFAWEPRGETTYAIAVGTEIASGDFYWGQDFTSPNATVSNLPTDGSTIYIRIFDLSDWSAKDFTVTAYTGEPDPNPNPEPGSGQPIGGITECEVTPQNELTAIWANTGEDKVVQHDLRGTCQPDSVLNSVWDGQRIRVFGARNEVVNFNVILEAGSQKVDQLSYQFNTLEGPNGFNITGRETARGDDLFNYVGRNIENFYVRYLEIKGLSAFMGGDYDQRHLPRRWRRPFDETYGFGLDGSTWSDRPDHNQFYPDIAVPLELHQSFDIVANLNQSIWTDIYIPKEAPSGLYTGTVTITRNGQTYRQIPVELEVKNFTLPDMPNSKTMLVVGDYASRYGNDSSLLMDRHFKLAHRHKISLIGDDAAYGADQPNAAWLPRLNGVLFTASSGYDGPGVGVGNNVYSIGTYSAWNWKDQGEVGMRLHSDNYANWFAQNAPDTEYFLYLIDESNNYDQIEQWAAWINNNPGPGRNMKSLATIWGPDAYLHTPSLDIATSGLYVGQTDLADQALNYFQNEGKSFFLYNSGRPAGGSFVMEDDGISLRQKAWGQFKKGIDRFFYWQATYYNNYQGGMGHTNVYQNAMTFGAESGVDNLRGESGWNYSNGDGVMMYPGTDVIFPEESYGLLGPIPSLRLKYWRRGIQDVDYLTLASEIDPDAVEALMQKMNPKVLWEYGVATPEDPTWVRGETFCALPGTCVEGWPDDPNFWEEAREELAQIIESASLE